MKTYRYTMKTESGKILAGEIAAKGYDEAVSTILNGGGSVIEVQEVKVENKEIDSTSHAAILDALVRVTNARNMLEKNRIILADRFLQGAVDVLTGRLKSIKNKK